MPHSYAIDSRKSSRNLARIGFLGVLAAFVLLNAAAFYHARAMTHFVPAGERTRPPERLSAGGKIRVLLTGVNLPRPAHRAVPRDFGLNSETVSFPGIGGLSVEAWLLRSNRRRGLILLFHGYADSRSSLLPAAREFITLGFDCLLVDFNGSGGSAGDETSLGYHEARAVAAAVEWAGTAAPAEKPVLYGVSMGAAAVLRAVSALHVEPRGIIVVSPFDRLLSSARHRFGRMGLPLFPFAQLLVFWGGIQQGFNGFAHNPRDYARSVRCPALMLFGDRDAYISIGEARGLYENLAGAKTLKVFEGARHEDFAVSRPEEWRFAVQGFLRKLGP